MLEDGHLLIIAHQIPGADQRERVAAFFWRNPQGEWRSHGANGGSAAQFLDTYNSRVERLDEAESAAIHAREYHAVLEEAVPLLRASRGLHRCFQHAREMVRDDRSLIHCRDHAAGIERSAELLIQDAQFGLNFVAARQAEEQAHSARRMAATAHRLNVLVALFLPLTAITGLFSIEVPSGIEHTPQNFLLIAVAGIILGLVLCVIIGKRH